MQPDQSKAKRFPLCWFHAWRYNRSLLWAHKIAAWVCKPWIFNRTLFRDRPLQKCLGPVSRWGFFAFKVFQNLSHKLTITVCLHSRLITSRVRFQHYNRSKCVADVSTTYQGVWSVIGSIFYIQIEFQAFPGTFKSYLVWAATAPDYSRHRLNSATAKQKCSYVTPLYNGKSNSFSD